MAGVLEPITFTQNLEGEIKDLIIPREFIRDIESRKGHLMIYIRVTGPDTWKVTEFFEEREGNIFTIDTTENMGEKISDDYVLTSTYIDDGPPISTDIDVEPPMIRAILDFDRK
jgi:hypothetical protein